MDAELLDFGETKRFCPQCRTPKPRSEFGLSAKSGRLRTFCRECVVKQKKLRRESQLSKAGQTQLKLILATLNDNRIDVPHTSEFAAEVIERLGGVKGAAEWIVQQAKIATALKPGGKQALDFGKLVVSLIVESTKQRDTAPDVGAINDADLDQEFDAAVVRILKEHPRLAKAAFDKAQGRIEESA